MTEEQLLAGHLRDLARRSYDKNIYTYSGFLNLNEQSQLDTLAAEFPIHYEMYGGHELAERKVAGFGDADIFGYEGEFPISVIEISPLSEKYSDELNHRDYLGSLMNLGIRRETLGDILIKGKNAYLFALDDMAEHICSKLCRVKHTSVNCQVVDADIPELRPSIVEESHPVSSLRIDTVIATVCNISRKTVSEHFERGNVTLNSKVTSKPTYLMQVDDIFSVRGIGKFRFLAIGGKSKRGKTYVTVGRFV